jgi:periplasmic divalent cation tolerance protein
MSTYCMITTAASNREAARTLARDLVDGKLAACVQLVAVDSVYSWRGERTEEAEVLLLIKTRTELYDEVEAAISTQHPYEVPEIMQVPIERGLPAYLNWIDEVTG